MDCDLLRLQPGPDHTVDPTLNQDGEGPVPVCSSVDPESIGGEEGRVREGRGPLPETVAACACQISMGESRSNNATQNTVEQPFPAEQNRVLTSTCALAASVERAEGCAGIVGWLGHCIQDSCKCVFAACSQPSSHTHTHTQM